MKVLFVTRKYPPRIGGMESLSYELTVGFPEPKTIVALGGSQLHLLWFLPYALLRTALSAHKYDVIHLGDALLCSVGFIPRALFGRRVVVSVHGLDLTFSSRLYQLYLRLFLRADAFIANSEATAELARARGLPAVRSISLGVASKYFEVQRSLHADVELEQRRRGRTVLVTLGRLVRRKGAAWFVRNVLPKLSDVLYVVIGEGADRKAVESAVAECSAEDKVWLVGGVSQQRLLTLLSASDVFVMPNIEVEGDVEGFGIVAIEAAAAALPVVASNLQGIPDAIADGKNGVLVAPGDADGFAAAIERVRREPLRTELGQSARAYTLLHNGYPAVIERYRAAFAEVIDPARR
jgi:phosphatidylinositol alpha-1,6-mannosyltransferase